MAARTLPPFRADHVGSLLRPRRAAARRGPTRAAGTVSAEELRAVEDAAIRDVVRMQEGVGLQSATDGEFRRTSWHMDFIYQLGGVHQADEKLTVKFYNPAGTIEFASAALRIDGRIALAGHHLRRRLPVPAGPGDHGHAEADDPLPQHGALPGRPGRDRSRRSTRSWTRSGTT